MNDTSQRGFIMKTSGSSDYNMHPSLNAIHLVQILTHFMLNVITL